MVKLDHDDVAQNADMGSVYDRLAEHFRRGTSLFDVQPTYSIVKYDSLLASDMVGEQQN